MNEKSREYIINRNIPELLSIIERGLQSNQDFDDAIRSLLARQILRVISEKVSSDNVELRKKRLNTLIERGSLHEALMLMKSDYASSEYQALHIGYINRYKALEYRDRAGTISFEEYQIQIQRIIQAVTSSIRELEESDLENIIITELCNSLKNDFLLDISSNVGEYDNVLIKISLYIKDSKLLRHCLKLS